MINSKHVLEKMDLDINCVIRAVQQVRQTCDVARDPTERANKIILDVTDIQTSYVDYQRALHVAQAVVETAIQNDYFDPADALAIANTRHTDLVAKYGWTVVNENPIPGDESAPSSQSSSKKPNKGDASMALYLEHVVNNATPISNVEFIDMLVKTLDMTRQGASSYAYTCKKKHTANQ